MKDKSVEIWCVDIYVKFKHTVFCTLEFTSFESASRMLTDMSVAQTMINLNHVLLPVKEFRYARIRKEK